MKWATGLMPVSANAAESGWQPHRHRLLGKRITVILHPNPQLSVEVLTPTEGVTFCGHDAGPLALSPQADNNVTMDRIEVLMQPFVARLRMGSLTRLGKISL